MAQRLPLADIQFIADFAAFARSKGRLGYNFYSFEEGPCGCAVTQFLHTRGVGILHNDWSPKHALVDSAVRSKPWTFTALADRLEAILADAPVVVRS
jgi:hypothetical protein